MKAVDPNFFASATLDVAPQLIGTVLEYDSCRGRIVEVEAYTDDVSAASQTVDIDAGDAIQPKRVILPWRGESVSVKFSGEGSAQPLDLAYLKFDYTPPIAR